METNLEDKTANLEKAKNDTGNNTKVDSSQSHEFMNRVKREDLRSTKSSPHRNLELHHTRSFSEIYHLHPSCTDISCMSPICPKPKALSDLQHEVRRPESVLELSDLGAFSGSDDESGEDVMTTQQRGDEAMKIFLESNINVPLDGALTSSSLSVETLDSDIASESELVMGNWERGKIESIASTASNIEKRFLTPSGLLLYREHQVDSMLDTKRLKLTASSSERPISPLAMRKNGEDVKYKTSGGSESGPSGNENCERGRRYGMDSDSDSEEQEHYMNREIPVDYSIGKKIQNRASNCDLRLQDLKQAVHKYELQCEELINRSKQQHDEIKTLRKENVNLHKEHDRLQGLVRECCQNEDDLKENMTAFLKEKEENIEELKQTVQELEKNRRQKNAEIVALQNTIDNHVELRDRNCKTIKEINNESKALLQALAKELCLEDTAEIDNEENAEAIALLLKTRRQSLPDDCKKFYQKLNGATDAGVVENQNRTKREFCEASAGYKDTMSKIQKAEKGIGKTVKRSISLESLSKQRRGKNNRDDQKKTVFEGKLRELERTNEGLIRENKMLQDDCKKWKLRCEKILEQNVKNAEGKATAKIRGNKNSVSEELKKLKKYLKERRRSFSETQLQTLQGSFSRQQNSTAEISSSREKKEDLQGVKDLEDRLKQLLQLTDDLSKKIEKSDEQLRMQTTSSEGKKERDVRGKGGTKGCPDRVLSMFYGGKLFSVVKGMYNDQLCSQQDIIRSREREFRQLQEQLTVKESNDEVTRCCIESMKRTISVCEDELRHCKYKNRDLKRELRELKDWVLVKNAEREMALFYCKKNGIVDGVLVNHEDYSDSQPVQRDTEDVYGIINIEDTSYSKTDKACRIVKLSKIC